MINRELGLVEIYNRIKNVHTSIGVKTFRRNLTEPLRSENLNYIIMDEGADVIIKHGSRSNHGYPARRVLEVILEIGCNATDDITVLFRNVRKAVFCTVGTFALDNPTYTSLVADNTFIQENRTEGPTGIELPDIKVMRLVLDLVYTDIGFY